MPLAVGRVILGHHTSDPYVATDTIQESTALTNGPGAAPLYTRFRRLMC